MEKILLIDDSPSVRSAMERYFFLHDLEMITCSTCREGRVKMKEQQPDLAIIDIDLPDGNGFFLARELQSIREVPFLFLTGKNDESDRLLGLELGASDYVVKPFSMKELTLRIQGILRRRAEHEGSRKNTWKYNNNIFEVDLQSRRARINKTRIDLTSTEWEIITALLSNEKNVTTRDQLKEKIWFQYEEKNLRTIDSHIKNIRHKLGNSGWIKSVRNSGFRFSGEACHG